MRGIDVSLWQGAFDWDSAKRSGIGFAILKATQGRKESDPNSGAITDPYFYRNATECARLGIPYGAYHFLTCRSIVEAIEEAQYFCSALRSSAPNMTLWAAVDLESAYLTTDKAALTDQVKAFTDTVAANGYRPMIYTNTDWLRNRITRDESVPLWLALWTTFEEYARAYEPTVWQYGLDRNFSQSVDGDILLGELEEDGTFTPTEHKKEEDKARRYPSWEAFDEREQGIAENEGEVFFRKRGGLQNQYPSWSYFKAAEEEYIRETVGPAEIVVIPITYNGGRAGLVVDAYPKQSAGEPAEATVIPARRTRLIFDLDGRDITAEIEPYLTSLSYTDADADEADDLQFTLSTGDMGVNEKIVSLFADNNTKALSVTLVKATATPDGSVSEESQLLGAFYVDAMSETIVPTKVTVKATSIELTDAAKKKISRSWGENGQISLLEISNAIASNLGVMLSNQGTNAANIMYGDTLAQYRQTDIEFLTTLCASANISVKLSNGYLALMESQRDTLQNAIVVTPQDCSSISFTRGSALLEYYAVTVNYTDTDGSFYYGTAYNREVKGGKHPHVSIKVSSNAEAKQRAEDILKSYDRYIYTASMTVPGTLKLASGNTLMLDGFGAKDGRYTITEVKHKVSSSGFVTSVELREAGEEE